MKRDGFEQRWFSARLDRYCESREAVKDVDCIVNDQISDHIILGQHIYIIVTIWDM